MTFGDTSDDYSSEQDINPTRRKSFAEFLTNFEPPNALKKSKNKHKCPQCNAVFTRPYRLKNHIDSQHMHLKAFKCNDCNKAYTSNSHLKRHKITAHSSVNDNLKEVICGEENCNLTFANKYSLQKHILRKHLKPTFKCFLCNEIFQRKSQLNAHKVEIHHNEAEYKCNQCDKIFVQLHLYNKHKREHKTYICDCEKTFLRWSDYLKHKKTECKLPKSEHKCAICDKIFTLRQNLTQHVIKVHVQDSNDDTNKCPYLNCNRCYKYKKNLNFHIKTVHEKTFNFIQCPKCEIVLKSNKYFKNHLRTMHSKEKLKEKKPRKPRKDKRVKKKSMAAELSGVKASLNENRQNIKGLKVVIEKMDIKQALDNISDKVDMNRVLAILNHVKDTKESLKVAKSQQSSKINENEPLLTNNSPKVIKPVKNNDIAIDLSSSEDKLDKINEDQNKELNNFLEELSDMAKSVTNTDISIDLSSSVDKLDEINEDQNKELTISTNSVEESSEMAKSVINNDSLFINGDVVFDFPELNMENQNLQDKEPEQSIEENSFITVEPIIVKIT